MPCESDTQHILYGFTCMQSIAYVRRALRTLHIIVVCSCICEPTCSQANSVKAPQNGPVSSIIQMQIDVKQRKPIAYTIMVSTKVGRLFYIHIDCTCCVPIRSHRCLFFAACSQTTTLRGSLSFKFQGTLGMVVANLKYLGRQGKIQTCQRHAHTLPVS